MKALANVIQAWGGSSYAWSSGHIVGVLVVGFVSLVAFALYGTFSVLTYHSYMSTDNCIEIFVPIEQPLLPMSLLKHRGYSATVCSALVGNMVYFSMRYEYAPRYRMIMTLTGFVVCYGPRLLPPSTPPTLSKLVGSRYVSIFKLQQVSLEASLTIISLYRSPLVLVLLSEKLLLVS